jgi:hypothetical protein
MRKKPMKTVSQQLYNALLLQQQVNHLHNTIASHDAFIAKHPHGKHSQEYIFNKVQQLLKSLMFALH